MQNLQEKYLPANVAWTRKYNFDKCNVVFVQEFERFFIQSPELVEQFQVFETKNFQQMVPLDTLIAVFDKTDKIILSESSKMLCSKSLNEKEKICQKREHFSFRMFLRTLRLQFSLSCRKVSAKRSKNVCSRSEYEKKSTFFGK